MVKNRKLWKVMDNIPGVDEAIISGFSTKVPELAASDLEEERQRGRKIEAALLKIDQLEKEHHQLVSVAELALKTQNDDFSILFITETLATDKTSGGQVKQLSLRILDDAIKINRLEYLTAYLTLYKSGGSPTK